MTKRLALTTPAYENLIAHLVDMEERRLQLINLYFQDYNKQRDEFEQLMDNYISQLDNAVKNTKCSENSDNYFPFVCLNSEIEIEDIEESETYSYRIIVPESIHSGDNCITMLSPMGRALLCKNEGEVVSVNTPSGVYRYRIKSIRI